MAVLMIVSAVSVVPQVAYAQRADGANWWTGRQLMTAATCGDPVIINNTDAFCVFLHPGVEDAWKHGWSHTLGTLWGLQGGTDQQRQIYDKYLDYAILASGSDSIGDLQFDVQIQNHTRQGASIAAFRIIVPPEFRWLGPTKAESVWTDMTNDNNYIDVTDLDQYDTVAPGWTQVTIGSDALHPADDGSRIEDGIYHIRLFNLAAPTAAGIYHFKLGYYSLDPLVDDWVSLGAANYPFVVVKTELNPAYVIVTVHTQNYFAGDLSGWVQAVGTTPEGRAVEGVGYWSGYAPAVAPMGWLMTDAQGDLYQTVLLGLAAGTYEVTAWATGFDPTISGRFTLDPGQSYEIHIDLKLSPIVCVQVWSKHGTGAIPWHNLWQLPLGTNNPAAPIDPAGPARDIQIELYDSSQNLIGWWASNDDSYNDHNAIPQTNATLTSYYMCLVDSLRLLGGHTVAATHWDGHVPADVADYIEGMSRGSYSVEAFVTGYIMDEADAYQRSFVVVGNAIVVQMDLRRSNWIETVLHLTAPMALYNRTLVLTADDAAGNERATMAALIWGDQADLRIDGQDITFADGSHCTVDATIDAWTDCYPAIVIEGYNHKGYSGADKDYGLNPTASSHSAGSVTLAGNPYTVKMWMADMGLIYSYPIDARHGTGWYYIVGGDPMVSVYLCNSPVPLSFSILPAWVWISLRSVDFEVPAHSRPWTFPGSEITVDFKDVATGDVVDTHPTVYGLFQDPGCGGVSGYNCTLAESLGLQPDVWNITGVDYTPLAGFATNHGWGYTPYDFDDQHTPGLHEHLAVAYYGTDGYQNDYGADLVDALTDYPTRLDPAEYTFDVYTHGYVVRRIFPFFVPAYGHGDIEADLIQGGQIRVCIDFFHEGIPTDFYGFVRVEVFNSENALVGASIYGQAQPNPYVQVEQGGSYLHYVNSSDYLLGSVMGNTETGLREAAQGAGLGDLNHNGTIDGASESARQRADNVADFVNVTLGQTWSEYSALDPLDANRLLFDSGAGNWSCFDVYGFYKYSGAAARTWAGGWPTTDGTAQNDYGLKGTVDIPGWSGSGGGVYSMKVWAFDPVGPDHILNTGIPSDDWRMYAMSRELTNIQVPWGGAQLIYLDMNDMAKLSGTVRWFDMYGNLKPLPWAQVSASPGPSTDSIPAYTTGIGGIGPLAPDSAGTYIMWLPAGSHDVSVSTSESPGVWTSASPTINSAFTVVVSDGWVGNGDAQLSGSGTPVPELPAFVAPLALFAALAASVWLLKKRNINIPVMMK